MKRVLSPELRRYLKRLRRHLKERMKGHVPRTSLDELKEILVNDLGLRPGDNVFVTSSFGNLNANYSPQDVVELLQSIVTKEGLIMMPYYPPMNSDEWVKGGYIFDMEETKSGMGVLTNVFSKMAEVYKSKHPTKAVCAWGKDALFVIADHDKSTTPFYYDSPYGKLFKLGSKSLGLGVKNMPMFHLVEDIIMQEPYYYLSVKYNLPVRQNGVLEYINTYIHNNVLLSNTLMALDYVVKVLKCKSLLVKNFGYAFLYCIDNSELYNEAKIKFKQGITRTKR